ncbi:hypothetical protein MKW98_028103, partial [Papaver atlanticum]
MHISVATPSLLALATTLNTFRFSGFLNTAHKMCTARHPSSFEVQVPVRGILVHGHCTVKVSVKRKRVYFLFFRSWTVHKEYGETVLPILDSNGKEITLDEVEKQTSFITWLADK